MCAPLATRAPPLPSRLRDEPPRAPCHAQIRIQILDCFCVGDEDIGFKCSMPDLLTGTNLGESAFGPPTGRKVMYRGNVNSILAKTDGGVWKYIEEFAVHDEWSLMTQLGVAGVPAPDVAEYQRECEPIMPLVGAASTDLGDSGGSVDSTPTPAVPSAADTGGIAAIDPQYPAEPQYPAVPQYTAEPAAKQTVRSMNSARQCEKKS